MKVIVTGSRDCTDYEAIRLGLVRLGVTAVVEGGARGADRLARRAAAALGIPCETVAADWATHGTAAGSLRNQAMLDLHPDATHVLAFPLPHSRGTYDMIRRARPTRVVIVWPTP